MRTFRYFIALVLMILIIGIFILCIPAIKSSMIMMDSISNENILKALLIIAIILATAFLINRIIDLFKTKKNMGNSSRIIRNNQDMIGRRPKK